MKDPRREYETALADFAQPGGRWNAKGRLTYWGKAAGLTADEIISDARAAGVHNRDADIRRGWADAKPRGNRPSGCYIPRARPKPPPIPDAVRNLVRNTIRDGGGTAHAQDLADTSPTPIPSNPRAQTALWLRTLFDPGDLLFNFWRARPAAGKPGYNLRTARNWLDLLDHGGDMHGDVFVPNSFSGVKGQTTDGNPSFVSKSCLVRFPFVVVEFDGLPVETQAAFWLGLLKSPLGRKVCSVVYSGDKSLHGLLHVGCKTMAEWTATRDKLKRLFCSDPDTAYCVDPQSMEPRQGTRLPGVRRFSDGKPGKMQRLLYLNPAAVRQDVPTGQDPRQIGSAVQEQAVRQTGGKSIRGGVRQIGSAVESTGAELGRELLADGGAKAAREAVCKRTERDGVNYAPGRDGRATDAPRCGIDKPPPDAPLDDILAYFAALDAAAAYAARQGGG